MSRPKSDFELPQFGPNLKRLRELRGLSQAELAAQISVQQTYISALELGHKNCSLGLAAKLAEALEIKLEKFLENISNRG